MTTMKQVLFNDGEGADVTDLNAVSSVIRAQLWDMATNLRGGAFYDKEYGTGSLTRSSHLWVFGDSAAPYPAVTPLVVNTLPGVIMQWTSAFGSAYTTSPVALGMGEDAQCVPAYVAAGDLSTLHDVGGASPRFDVVSLAFSYVDGDIASRDFKDATTGAVTTSTPNTRHNVFITKTVTKGTGAVNPVLPALPAGTVPLYAVYVPAGYNAAFDPAMIFDLRMPLGTFTIDVHAVDMYTHKAFANGGSISVLPGGIGGIEAGLTNMELYFVPFGRASNSARLIGLQALTQNTGTSTFSIMRVNGYNNGDTPVAYSVSPGPSSGVYTPTAPIIGGTVANPNSAFNGGALGMNPFDPVTGQGQLPVWINGRPNPYALRAEQFAANTQNTYDRVCVKWVAGTTNARVNLIRFIFAGGA